MAEEAGKKIVELRNRLAEREMITAELYRKLYSNKAALVYYDVIIDEFPDTDHYEAAFVGKLEVLTALRRYEDVKIALELYKRDLSMVNLLMMYNQSNSNYLQTKSRTYI